MSLVSLSFTSAPVTQLELENYWPKSSVITLAGQVTALVIGRVEVKVGIRSSEGLWREQRTGPLLREGQTPMSF